MDLVDRLRACFEIDGHPLAPVDAAVRTGNGLAVEDLTFATAAGERVRGVLVRPAEVHGPLPAILYIHAHGGAYDIGVRELMEGRSELQGPYGPVLAREGYAALCIEMPCFGTRAGTTESAAAKRALWHGRSLAGQMMGEQAAAVRYLATRDDMDATRIGALGLSMGATFAYWLAAVEPAIACVAHLCCYADFATLIQTGAHDGHGIYLTVPGLLDIAGNGEIAGLIAPRPQLVCAGDQDPLAPPPAVDRALVETRAAYAGAPDRLVLCREAETGHCETPAMREQVLDFLRIHLR